jgi:hypothetical protein
MQFFHFSYETAMVQWQGSRMPIQRDVVQIQVGDYALVFFIFFNYLYLLNYETIQLQLKIQIQFESKIFCLTKIFCAPGI